MVRKLVRVWFATGALIVFAQSQPHFDAASIRPSTGGEGPLHYAPGRVAGTVTLRRLILDAYHIGPLQLSGGPGWMNSDQFAIEAKATSPVNKDELRRMLQTLLAERFKLAVRRESKKMPVFTLTVAKGGVKLRELKPGDPLPAPAPANPPLVRVFFTESMHDFVERLNAGDSAGRPVVDQTGLSGIYVFDFLVHGSHVELPTGR